MKKKHTQKNDSEILHLRAQIKQFETTKKEWQEQKHSLHLKFECLKKMIGNGKPQYCKDLKLEFTNKGSPPRSPQCHQLRDQCIARNSFPRKQKVVLAEMDAEYSSMSYVITQSHLHKNYILQAIKNYAWVDLGVSEMKRAFRRRLADD